jgi:uncharacterized protein YhaN
MDSYAIESRSGMTQGKCHMWLSRLDLIAFGKFTDVRLTLGPGFHLVYGPNEAGKSTTLRAIRQLLFGFDERTDDNFVHSNPNLRIGGVLSSGSGEELEVIRRKTRKDSLRAGDDMTIVDPNRWAQFLVGIDETIFQQRYGIDYEQLVQGGHQIATGSGDLGDILFATGSGVTDLNSVKKKLVDDAAEIFKPQGKKQRLNQSIVMLQEQKDLLRDKFLSVGEWEEADRIRQETLLRLEHVSANLINQTNDRDRYLNWKLAWPLVQELDSVEKELEHLGPTPRFNQDFNAKRLQAIQLLKQHSIHEQAATDAIRIAQNELEKLAMPQDLMRRSDEIASVVTEWGACQKGLSDRLKLIEDRDRHQASIRELRQSMTISTNQIADTTVILDRPFRTRLGQLGRQQTGLQQSHQQATHLYNRISAQLQELQESLKTIPEDRPLEAIRNLLRKVQSDGDLEARLALAREEMAAMEEDARQQIDRFGLGLDSISQLASIKLPDPNLLKQLESGFQENHSEQLLLSSRLADFDIEHKKLCLTIEKLRNEFQLPTEADLEIARNRRAEVWLEIRGKFSNNTVPEARLIEEFERLINEADSIADRLRIDADRVAQLAEEMADLETNEARRCEATVRMAELDAERIALERRWQLEWQSVGAKAPLPNESEAWIAHRETLLQSEIHIRRCEQDAKTLARQIQENVEALSKLIEIGSTNGNEFTLKNLIARVEGQLMQAESAQQHRRETTESIARWTRELSESMDRLTTAENALSQWKSDWGAVMCELGLPPDSSPDTAGTLIETLVELTDHQRQAEQFQERILGIDTDTNRLTAKVNSLCREIAPDLVDTNVGDSVAALRDRMIACQRDETVRNMSLAKRSQAEQQLNLAHASRESGKRLVDELCQAAGIVHSDMETISADDTNALDSLFQELEAVEKRSINRDALERRLERVRARLTELSMGEPLNQFVEHVRQQSFESMTDRVSGLELEINRLTAERDQLNQQLGRSHEQLRRMDGGETGAFAEESRQQTLAQIRSDAETYVRLKLASSILHSSIERYRERTRGPILAIASELFRELTLGSFDGLRVEEDDDCRPVLVGIRPGSRESVTVNGMSEGTCDQLYLALRLATLQLETEPRSKLPLIIDDVLIQFDDDRAEAALRILTRLGQQRQVIFFTHHEHLLEIASQKLSNGYTAHKLVI